jgi:hypothetical protein
MTVETVKARGHKHVLGKHKTTFEVTKETHLTPGGDCIVGISADKSISELSEKFKSSLKSAGAKIEILLKIPGTGLEEKVTAFGSHELTFTHPTDIVVRKSNFICPRTLAINANKAAADFSREFIEKLKNADAELLVEFNVVEENFN